MALLFKAIHTYPAIPPSMENPTGTPETPAYTVSNPGSGMQVGDYVKYNPAGVTLQISSVNGTGGVTGVSIVNQTSSNQTYIPTVETSTMLSDDVSMYTLNQTWTNASGTVSTESFSYAASIGPVMTTTTPRSYVWHNSQKKALAIFKKDDAVTNALSGPGHVLNQEIRMFTDTGFVSGYAVDLSGPVSGIDTSPSIVASNGDLSITVVKTNKGLQVIEYDGTSTTVSTISPSSSSYYSYIIARIFGCYWDHTETSVGVLFGETWASSGRQVAVIKKVGGVWGLTVYSLGGGDDGETRHTSINMAGVVSNSYYFAFPTNTAFTSFSKYGRLSSDGTKIFLPNVDSTVHGVFDLSLTPARLIYTTSNYELMTWSTAEYFTVSTPQISPDFNNLWYLYSNSLTGINSGTTSQFNAVTNNKYDFWVAVGNGGIIYTSSDRVNWTSRSSGTTNNLNAVAYDSTYGWVAVGNSSTIVYSSDGISWTKTTYATTRNLTGVARVNNGSSTDFIAVGTGGLIIRASGSDLTTWTSKTSGTTNHLRCVSADYDKYSLSGLYITGDSGYKARYSGTNGTVTIETSTAISGTIKSVASYQSSLVCYAASTGVYVNTSGAPDVLTFVNLGFTVNSVIYSTRKSKWYAVGSGGKFAFSQTSAPSSTWVVGTTGISTDLYGIIDALPTSNNGFISVGASGRILASLSGAAWEPQIRSVSGIPNPLSYDAYASTETAKTATVTDSLLPSITGTSIIGLKKVDSNGFEGYTTSSGPYIFKTFDGSSTSSSFSDNATSSTDFDSNPLVYTMTTSSSAGPSRTFTLPTISFPYKLAAMTPVSAQDRGRYITTMTVNATSAGKTTTLNNITYSNSFTKTIAQISSASSNIVSYVPGDELTFTLSITST